MTLDLAVIGVTFLLLLPAELPDKTFIATLVLASRYPRWAVWVGVVAAFAVQCAIAVTAGGLLALLPARITLGITFVLFSAGAILMLVSGLRARPTAAEQEEAEEVEERADQLTSTSSWRIALLSFAILFTAEWGDLSQLLTAGMAARTGAPLSVFVGAWAALALIAGLAVLLGGWLHKRVPLWRVRIVSGIVLLALAGWTAVEFIRA